jgi:RNA recognition motif-containing protein
VITDAGSGRSKGYGFVRFASEPERDKALTEMNGHFLSNRPIRVSLATAKKNANTTTASAVQAPHPSDFDPTNTTLFIGGLSPSVSEDALRAVFARFGDIIYVKIPQGKGCGFVQFVLRTAAEQAMGTMNGQVRRRLLLQVAAQGAVLAVGGVAAAGCFACGSPGLLLKSCGPGSAS